MLVVVLVMAAAAPGACALATDADRTLHVGDSDIISCPKIVRAAVGDPSIADVAVASRQELLVNAKSPGKTLVYVWDGVGRKTYKVTVLPAQADTARLCEEISRELNDTRISVRGVGNTLILEGSVPSEAESSRAESIARAVAEMSVFRGVSSGDKQAAMKPAVRAQSEGSVVVEQISGQADTSVEAKSGLRSPRVVNLIRIERPVDEVGIHTRQIAAAVKMAIGDPGVSVRALPGGVVLIEGKVGLPSQCARIDNIAKGWAKEYKDTAPGTAGLSEEKIGIMNMVQVDTSMANQVMIRAQVVDINKTALLEFGVDWGRVVFQKSDIPGVDAVATVEDQPWLIGQSTFGPFDLFEGGAIERFDPIGARVRALEQQNKAKTLAQPNLLVIDGQEASILVGGEIPVPVVQSVAVGSAANVSVEYKEFGVRLNVVPNITGDGTLQLAIKPEVSSLDYSNAVAFSGFVIPALRVRRAQTIVNVRDGQSLVIGGLIQDDVSKLVKKIPLLGDLPIIGELFKTRTTDRNESELVIIVTPQIMKPNASE